MTVQRVERSEEEELQSWLGADTNGEVALRPAGDDGLSSRGDDSLTPLLWRVSAIDVVLEPVSTGSALRVPSLDLPKPSTNERLTNGALCNTLVRAARLLSGDSALASSEVSSVAL